MIGLELLQKRNHVIVIFFENTILIQKVHGDGVLMMTGGGPVVRGWEVVMTVALLLLDEHVKRLKLLLHVLNRVTYKFTNSHDVMLTRSH
jgi:hypothetical protein